MSGWGISGSSTHRPVQHSLLDEIDELDGMLDDGGLLLLDTEIDEIDRLEPDEDVTELSHGSHSKPMTVALAHEHPINGSSS